MDLILSAFLILVSILFCSFSARNERKYIRDRDNILNTVIPHSWDLFLIYPLLIDFPFCEEDRV